MPGASAAEAGEGVAVWEVAQALSAEAASKIQERLNIASG